MAATSISVHSVLLRLFQNSVTRDSYFRSPGSPPSLYSTLVLFCLYLIFFPTSLEFEGKLFLTIISRSLKSIGCAFLPESDWQIVCLLPTLGPEAWGRRVLLTAFLGEINDTEHLTCYSAD